MPTLTPNIKLQKPADAEFGWQNMLRQNSDTLDAEIAALKGVSQLTGTATGGSATTMVDAGLTLGIDAFAGGGVVIIHRAGVLLRAEDIISNTATTLTFATGAAPQVGDTYSIASQSGLAGAAAEVAAGRTNSVPRADGSWSARARYIPQDYALQTWADDLALGAYSIWLTVAQNGLPAGWWYIEVMRHTRDQVATQFRYLRAAPLDYTLAAKPVYHCSVVGGTWSAWTPVGDNPLTWYTPTFVNSWADYATGGDARYTKDLTNGVVYMKGLVKGGSNITTTNIFTLPVGMRPSTGISLSQALNGGIGRIDIQPSGGVYFIGTDTHTGNANSYLSISATFKGEL